MNNIDRIAREVCSQDLAMEAGRNSRAILKQLERIEKKLDELLVLLKEDEE